MRILLNDTEARRDYVWVSVRRQPAVVRRVRTRARAAVNIVATDDTWDARRDYL